MTVRVLFFTSLILCAPSKRFCHAVGGIVCFFVRSRLALSSPFPWSGVQVFLQDAATAG